MEVILQCSPMPVGVAGNVILSQPGSAGSESRIARTRSREPVSGLVHDAAHVVKPKTRAPGTLLAAMAQGGNAVAALVERQILGERPAVRQGQG